MPRIGSRWERRSYPLTARRSTQQIPRKERLELDQQVNDMDPAERAVFEVHYEANFGAPPPRSFVRSFIEIGRHIGALAKNYIPYF